MENKKTESKSDKKSEKKSETESEKKSENGSKNESENESKNKSEKKTEKKSETESETESESESENKNKRENKNKSENESENVNSTINTVNTTSNTVKPTSNALNPTSNVQLILDKIKNLPISSDDKAILMKQFKQNIINPSLNEDQNLSDIQKKYLNPKQIIDSNYINTQHDYSTFKDPNLNLYPQQVQLQPQQNLQIQPPFQQPLQYYNSNQQLQLQNMNQGDLMTKSQFEILKNKIDSLQYELIDLLRHVKDYTQRYMNSVRQQDLVKIDEYVNGLFEVDKSIKEVKEKSLELEAKAPEEADSQESVITKTTNGIKNAMGSLGSSMSGITSLVSSTANLANSYLSAPIIKKKDGEQAKTPKPNEPTEATETKNTNVVSVDEYIKDKENKEGNINLSNNSIKKTVETSKEDTTKKETPEEGTPEEKTPEEGTPEEETDETEEEAPAETEEALDETEEAPTEQEEAPTEQEESPTEQEEAPADTEEEAPTEQEESPTEQEEAPAETEEDTTEPEGGPAESEEETAKNLGNALQELNAKINTKTQPQSKIIKQDKKEKITSNIQSGGTYKTLKNNISLLKLKITKKKLQKKLKKELQKEYKNTKHNFKKHKIKKITKNKKKLNN